MQLDARVIAGSCGGDDKGEVCTNPPNGLAIPFVFVFVGITNWLLPDFAYIFSPFVFVFVLLTSPALNLIVRDRKNV